MRKIRITIIVTAVLAGAMVLAGNLFPDQVYAGLQYMKGWIGIFTNVVVHRPPALVPTPALPKSPTVRFTLLPESEIVGISRLCSRKGPKVDGSWKPTTADIAMLESHLSRISLLKSRGVLNGINITHPGDCYRQYVPIIVAGRKLIYVNAFCNIVLPEWRKQFIDICDGGESAWGVLYDPATGEFSELATNGVG